MTGLPFIYEKTMENYTLPLKFGAIFDSIFNIQIFALHPQTLKFLQFDNFEFFFFSKIPSSKVFFKKIIIKN
jgi:hypothetical protein